MLSLSDYLATLTAWNEANYLNNGVVRPDSAMYSHLSAIQQSDLGLLLQTLLKSDAQRLHLRCDEWQQTDELFGPLLATLCFYKYAQNQTETPVTELYKTGTVLYHPAKAEAKVVVSRHATGVITRPVKEETVRVKGDKHTQTKTFNPTFEQAAKYVPLANVSEHTYNRNALGNLADYFDLFNRTLHQHRAITQFPRRLLVVAPHATIQQLPAGSQLPIRYKFDRHYTVPVVCPLVEIVNRYNDARDELRKDGNTIDEVIVLGDIGYRDSLTNLLNDLGDGYFKRVTILGSQPIQSDYGFRCWSWSANERTWLRTRKLPPEFSAVTIPSEGIKALRPLFDEPVLQLMLLGLSEAEAKAALNRLIGQYLRDALVDTPNLLAYHHDRLHDPTGVWAGWFIETGNEIMLSAFSAALMDGLDAVARYVTAHPAKLIQIEALAQPGVQTWVVARPRQVEALNTHFSHKPHIKAISYRELKKLLASPATRSEQFIFPALHLNYQPGGQLLRDYRLYRRALERGTGYVLNYDGLEEGLFRLCHWLYEREEHRCLTHPDRQHWVDFTHDPAQFPAPTMQESTGFLIDVPTQEAETLDHLLDELDHLSDETPAQRTRAADVLQGLNKSFALYFGVWKDLDRRQQVRSEDTPAEEEFVPVMPVKSTPAQTSAGSRIQISFSNRRDYEYKPGALLAQSANGTIQAIRADAVCKNNLIVHFAIDFDNCSKALLTIPEAKAAMNEVAWASKAWRDWLRDSVQKLVISKTIPWEAACRTRYQRLCKQVQQQDPADSFVSQDRFQFWLTKNNPYLFPLKISHLEAVLSACLKLVPPTNLAAKEAEQRRIMAARDQSASFREVVTRLNHELTVYLTEKKKGAMLAHLSEQHLNALLQTQTLLTVIHTCQL